MIGPMTKLVLETTAPFQGLPELVAFDEGLFAAEGIEIEWASRDDAIVQAGLQPEAVLANGATPFDSHGVLFEQGKADMYNACEWGNYCRVGESAAGSRQIGRRAIVAWSAIAVPPDSPVFTPQQLAGRSVGVGMYAGTHYLALQLLEGFLPRDLINLYSAGSGAYQRLKRMLAGEFEATTVTEPHATLAEKMGCRLVCSAFFHGTEVASNRVSADTYAAFNRAVREAVRRINANKAAYMHYFIDYHKDKQPEVGTLKVEDLRESRLVVTDPAPIPPDEMQRTYDWMKSWGMLEQTASAAELIDADIQRLAHSAA
jgi:NitT/TauT family transport system substrate-binding protein